MSAKHFLKCLAVFIFSYTALANPLDGRAACNADNCLRELRAPGNTKTASAYCASYLRVSLTSTTTITTTRTVIPTVFSIYGKNAVTPRAAAPEPTVLGSSPPEMEKRQLPPFASSCTGAATRLSSACSCLITTTIISQTTTSTLSVAPATSTVCVPPNYGAIYFGEPDYNHPPEDDVDPHFSSTKYSEVTDIGDCCALCYNTPECVQFDLAPPDYTICQLTFLVGSIYANPRNNLCPAGIIGNYFPQVDISNEAYGFGPCAYYIDDDE